MNTINIFCNGKISIEIVGKDLVVNGKIVPKNIIKGGKVNYASTSIVNNGRRSEIKFFGGNKIVIVNDKVSINGVSFEDLDLTESMQDDEKEKEVKKGLFYKLRLIRKIHSEKDISKKVLKSLDIEDLERIDASEFEDVENFIDELNIKDDHKNNTDNSGNTINYGIIINRNNRTL